MFGAGQNSTFFPMSTFLQVVELLLTDADAKATYAENPPEFLEGHGLGGFDSVDVSDAMTHAADALPIGVAVQLDPDEGLESAAGLDLEAQGLTLEREPVELTDDSLVEDADPFGADVDFDTPDGDAESPRGEAAADVVDAFDAADTSEAATEVPTESLDLAYDTADIDEALPEEQELADEAGSPADELGLTEPLLDELPLDEAEDTLDGAETGVLDTDMESVLTDDLPDEFDLLD